MMLSWLPTEVKPARAVNANPEYSNATDIHKRDIDRGGL